MATLDGSAELEHLLGETSAGDLSILVASCSQADATFATVTGSNNERLWSEMERLGWLERRTFPTDLPIAPLLFAPTPEGRDRIRLLVERLEREADSRAQASAAAMTAICNGAGVDFLRLLYREVGAGGGDHQDVHRILALTTVRSLNTLPAEQRAAMKRLVIEIVEKVTAA